VVLSVAATPGRVYELIYKSSDPAISGLGLAAVRDLISFLKYGGSNDAALGDQHTYLKHAMAFGSSQSAMMLKALVYEGFNADERGRTVFDGIFADVAGGRRSTFQRFTQHARTAGPLRNASFSTTDQFPFSDAINTDPQTGISDGLLARARKQRVIPKILYTNSSYEYWGTSAAFLHASINGKDDIVVPETSRVYMLAGGQHSPAALNSAPGRARYAPNPNDYRWIHRALLGRLQAWVTKGEEPPRSQYPRLSAKTLVPFDQYSFPSIPNIATPRAPHISERLDFRTEPPQRGKPFPAFVPDADGDGIDIAGVKMPWVSVPLGTFTGWNLRAAATGGADELLSQTGSFIPFPLSPEARTSAEDPRASIQERYKDRAEYLDKIRKACMELMHDGFLLERDLPAVVNTAERYWEAITGPGKR
jgi:hypothetical protein